MVRRAATGRAGASGEESIAFCWGECMNRLQSVKAFGWCVGRRRQDLRKFSLESLLLGRLLSLQVETEPSF